MAEAIAMIGLASALAQLIEFGGKVLRQLRKLEADAAGLPTLFQSIRSRLPLMVDLVKKIMLRMDAGLVDPSSQEMMLPVVQRCTAQAEELDKLISKTLPQPNESSWARGKKAVFGVLAETEIERIDGVLKANIDLLAQAGLFHAVGDGDHMQAKRSGAGPGMFNFLGSNVQVTLQSSNSASAGPPDAPLAKAEDGTGAFGPRAQSATQPPSNRSVFMVPFHRDPNFLGRRSALDLIDRSLKSQPCIALAGLGGMGKSQIAIEYAYIYHERYPHAPVFWVYGSDPVRFEESYHHIARRMTLPGWDEENADALQLVYNGLSSEDSGKWLFILDNADDVSMFHGRRVGERSSDRASDPNGSGPRSYARYIPRSAEGSVLITTRDRRVGERLSGRHRPVDVSSMTVAESMELLRSKMAEDDWCEEDAMRLVDELSHLPLAITQAAAFISENCLAIAEYLKTLFAGDEDAKELLSEHLEDPRRDLDTENSVVRTWKLSFDQISRNIPRGAQMLSLVAVFDYHSVPVALLRRDKETEKGFRTALGALQAFSLLTATRGQDGVCKMHRLVALALHRWLEAQGTLPYWQAEGLRVLNGAFPGPGHQKYEGWPLYDALLPHVGLVLACRFETMDDLLASAQLMVAVSLYHMSRGKYGKAFDLCSRSFEIRQSLLPAEDPLTLDSVQTLGEALLHRGELQLAATMLRRAVAGRERALGAEHPDTLESLSDLSITLLELDDLKAAEETAPRALSGRQRVLGEDHPDTLVSTNIHAILLHRCGKLDEAKTQYATALRRREILLGEEHPDTIITRNNCARLLYDQSDLDGARTTLDRVLAGETKVLGAEGYDIQVSLSNSALVQAGQGDCRGANQTLLKVLGVRERLLGPAHPSTIFTLQMLANLHHGGSGDGLSQKTAQEFRAMVDARQKKGGSDGPATASALLRAGLLFD